MDKDIISMSYSIDSIEQTPSEDERFSKVHIKAFAEGDNAHTAPVTLEDLKRTAPSIYNVPIVVQFTRWTDDGIGTHDKSEVPVGFVYTKENPVRFEFDKERNKNFLAINGLLWNRYTKDIVSIIKKSNGKKKVSVEMRVNNPATRDRNGKRIMTDWTYYAITILSDEVTEACKGSQIELLQFAEDFANDKDNYINHLNFSENGEGVKMENEKDLTNEAETCDCAENGVVANAEEGKDETPVVQSQAEETPTPSAESDGNDENTPDEKQACVTEEIPAQMANGENDGASNNDVLESGCGVNQAEEPTDGESNEDEPEKKPEEDEKPSEQEMAMAKLTEENKNLSEENERLKADNEAYMAKIAAMSDYDELKQFKENTIAEEARMAKMAKVNAVFDSIAEKGINMSEEDKKNLISKVDEYSDVDAWANMAKATIFDSYESSDGVVRIGLPYEQKSNNSESVWDRLASKFN